MNSRRASIHSDFLGRVSCQLPAGAFDGLVCASWRYCASRALCFYLRFSLRPTAVYAADVGSVRGVVHDAKHLPIAQAQVMLKSATSEWSQTATTDSRGEFAFISVPIGDYVLTVSQPDFETRSQIVTVTSGFSPVAHVQLAKGPSLPAVTVTAAMDTAVPVTATPTTVVSREDIERTPGAEQTNNLAMITDFVPGAYVVHDQLHVRGGHQTTWAVDGVEIPNTNIASNLGPQIDPKDIDYLEIQRGSYEADLGDRTYGVFNVVPRTGFERDNQGELIASGGNFGQTNDYVSIGSHDERFAYYASINGNRSDLGIQTPVAQIIHDAEDGYGGFSTLIFNATPDDQFRFVFSARHDNYDIPNAPGQIADDVQRETDVFAILVLGAKTERRCRADHVIFLSSKPSRSRRCAERFSHQHHRSAHLDLCRRSGDVAMARDSKRYPGRCHRVGPARPRSVRPALQRWQQCTRQPEFAPDRLAGCRVHPGHIQADRLASISRRRAANAFRWVDHRERHESPDRRRRTASRAELDPARILGEVLPGASADDAQRASARVRAEQQPWASCRCTASATRNIKSA